MASGFVQQSRGRLEIESEQGAGTTIRMLFPISVQLDDEPVAEKPKSSTISGKAGENEHILVVEDSPEVLALAKEILESAGYRVSMAISGDEGMNVLRQIVDSDPVDLLFTDLVMPGGMNGIVLAEEAIKLDPRIGILMTTGYNEQLVADGPQIISRDVLGKPYRRNELLDRVQQALANRAPADGERRLRSDYGHAEA
jgi:CheY-like chemotaxis protein